LPTAHSTLSEPPPELLRAIFPWVEEEQTALKQRHTTLGRRGQDQALANFLELLSRLRHVILQDAAILSVKYPSCTFFNKYPPFNTAQFAAFASPSAEIIGRVEEEQKHQLTKLPENIAGTLRGILTTSNVRQEQAHNNIKRRNDHLESRFDHLEGLVKVALLSSNANKRRFATSLQCLGMSSCHPWPCFHLWFD
jgi:hypothetical protein